MQRMNIASLLNIAKLPTYMKRFERELDVVVDTDVPSISRPLQRLLHAKSKRLRPMFVIAVVLSQGAPIDKQVMRACLAIELMHISTLVHDDIIDGSAIRWNIATINSQEGANQAIVIGDYLLGKAFEQASLVGQDAASIISWAYLALCDGQSREMADEYKLGRTELSLKKAHYGKTASLFIAACQLGGLCAGVSKKQLENLGVFGENFGMTFQMVDDVLNLLSSEKLLGKPVGSDVPDGVYTLPIMLSLAGPNAAKVKKLLHNKDSQSALVELLISDGSIDEAIRRVQNYNFAAVKALRGFTDNEAIASLRDLPEKFLNLHLDRLVAPQYHHTVAKFIS